MSELNTESALPPRNHRLRRGVSLLPSLFTVGNLSCGYFAVVSTLKGTPRGFDEASLAIGFAFLFDALDGRIARVTGTTSEFGKQFDSLADVISFGIAPAMLAFTWGVHNLFSPLPGMDRNVYWLGLIVTATFLLCCAWRLARFNIEGMAPGQDSRYFVGLPTPAAAAMIAAPIHTLKEPVQDWRFALGWIALIAALAALMTSTVRYYGFKDINLRRRRSSLVVVLVGLFFWSFVALSEYVPFLLAATYVLSGVSVHAFRALRRRAGPPPPQAPSDASH